MIFYKRFPLLIILVLFSNFVRTEGEGRGAMFGKFLWSASASAVTVAIGYAARRGTGGISQDILTYTPHARAFWFRITHWGKSETDVAYERDVAHQRAERDKERKAQEDFIQRLKADHQAVLDRQREEYLASLDRQKEAFERTNTHQQIQSNLCRQTKNILQDLIRDEEYYRGQIQLNEVESLLDLQYNDKLYYAERVNQLNRYKELRKGLKEEVLSLRFENEALTSQLNRANFRYLLATNQSGGVSHNVQCLGISPVLSRGGFLPLPALPALPAPTVLAGKGNARTTHIVRKKRGR